jgi:hypothetical protein
VPESDVERIADILESIPEERVLQMQESLAKVWHRFVYHGRSPAFRRRLAGLLEENARLREDRRSPSETPASLPAPFEGELGRDDAFATVMQWLYSKRTVHRKAL